MALTWDLTKINNYEEVCWKKNDDDTSTLNPATESLIWLSMGIGMGSITESNADEFYSRVCIYEKLNGPMRKIYHDDGSKEEVYVTPEEIHSHIGLKTNVGLITPAKFRKNVYDNAFNSSSRAFSNYMKSLIVEDADV